MYTFIARANAGLTRKYITYIKYANFISRFSTISDETFGDPEETDFVEKETVLVFDVLVNFSENYDSIGRSEKKKTCNIDAGSSFEENPTAPCTPDDSVHPLFLRHRHSANFGSHSGKSISKHRDTKDTVSTSDKNGTARQHHVTKTSKKFTIMDETCINLPDLAAHREIEENFNEQRKEWYRPVLVVESFYGLHYT